MIQDALTIRPELPGDAPAIAGVLTDAFAGPGEARLVEALRASGGLTTALVALDAERVVGHVALSPMTADGTPGPWLGLGPVAVAPAAQARGIGRRLVGDAVAAATSSGAAAVFVLGRSSYYAALGFEEAAAWGWCCTYPAVPAAFRVRRLVPARLPPAGTLRYHATFDLL